MESKDIEPLFNAFNTALSTIFGAIVATWFESEITVRPSQLGDAELSILGQVFLILVVTFFLIALLYTLINTLLGGKTGILATPTMTIGGALIGAVFGFGVSANPPSDDTKAVFCFLLLLGLAIGNYINNKIST